MEDEQWAMRVHFALLLNGLTQTLDHFRENWRNIRPTTHRAFHDSILRAFDRGDSAKFFEGLMRYVPQPFAEGEMGKVEFYSHVYFTTLPLLTNQKDKWAPALQKFKDFLNTKGSDLCKTSEFLQFYALPHVPSPQAHPSFKHFFTTAWGGELRERIRLFLENVESRSLKLGTEGLTVAQPANSALLDELRNAKKREADINSALVESQAKWTAFSLSIVQIGKELLDHVSQRKSVDLVAVRRKLMELERFLTTNGDDSASNASSLIPVSNKEQLVHLNYIRIKETLAKRDEDGRKCVLLQALRWRLTRTPASVRKEVMNEYIAQDLLRVTEDGLSRFLLACSMKTLDYAAKLINVFASECRGRTYLLQDAEVIHSLIKVLYREAEDSTLRQNAVGTLQKLSLRRKPQATMIELRMIEWLVGVLKRVSDLSEYSLEYSTALLMNLSLRTAGKKTCETPSLNVLQLLQSLMEHENVQVRTYVNGTLYSILARPILKVRARDMGLEARLRRLLASSDEMLQKQIQYIIDQLNAEGEDSFVSDEEAEEDDVESNEEEESEQISDDEDDADEMESAGLVGEELLRQDYQYHLSLSPPVEEVKVPVKRREALGSSLQESVECEPFTPIETLDPIAKRESTPSEFKAKPKVPRTPQILPLTQMPVNASIKDAELKMKQDPLYAKEPRVSGTQSPTPQVASEESRLKHAFQSRSRIPRTPPLQKGDKK